MTGQLVYPEVPDEDDDNDIGECDIEEGNEYIRAYDRLEESLRDDSGKQRYCRRDGSTSRASSISESDIG